MKEHIKKSVYFSRLVFGCFLASLASRLSTRAEQVIKNAEKGYRDVPIGN